MKKRTHVKRRDLRELLFPLIQEWGYEEIVRCLSEFKDDPSCNGLSIGKETNNVSRHQLEKKTKNTRRKLSPVDVVSKMKMPEVRKALLIKLATEFECKSFLPSVGDVRNFLEMRGEEIRAINQREGAFRKVLDQLLSMPDDELNRFIRSNAHTGPSDLGPVSNAIKSTSLAVKSNNLKSEDTICKDDSEQDID